MDWLEPLRRDTERIRQENIKIREETEKILKENQKLREVNRNLQRLAELKEKERLKKIIKEAVQENIYKTKRTNQSMKTLSFTEEQIKLLADAIWMRQRCFIAGDKRFKEYGTMLNEILEDIEYTPSRY